MYIEVVKKTGGFFTHGEILRYQISGNFLIITQHLAEKKTINQVFDLGEINYFKIYENENNEKNSGG